MKGDNISDDLPPVLYIGRTRYSFVIILLHQHLRVHLFPLKSVELVIVFFLKGFTNKKTSDENVANKVHIFSLL